jgi:hypothetical protein
MTAEDHELTHTGLTPPRFSLRTMLLVVTALCCLFAVMAGVGMIWSAVLLLFLSLVVAHVLGNSLGTKLRDQTSRQIEAERASRPPVAAAAPSPSELAEAPRRLTERTSLHRVTFVMAGLGAFVGAELGGVGVAAIYPQASNSAVALGVLSAAVLGALTGFLASSFIAVVRQALAEAHRGARPHVKRQVPGRSS